MARVEKTSIESDDKFHHYTGNDIPWYVRLMWLGFWILAVYYTIRYIFPSVQQDLFQ
jgi:hypothetical protein